MHTCTYAQPWLWYAAMQSQWGEQPHHVMRQRVGQLRQTAPAVKISPPLSVCSPDLFLLKHHKRDSGSQQHRRFLLSLKFPLPTTRQPHLASAWVSRIRFAARRNPSRNCFIALHYCEPCPHKSRSLHRAQKHRHALVQSHMLARSCQSTCTRSV